VARAPLYTRGFVLAFVANLFLGLSFHMYIHVSGFYASLGASEDVVGWFFGLASGAAIVIRPLAGRTMDTQGRRGVILAGALCNVLVCALYLTVAELGVWLAFVRVLQGFSTGAVFSGLFTYAADVVPAERRTEGMGLFGVSGMLPIALGALIGDFVLAHAGYRELFWASIGLGVLGVAAAWPLEEPARPRVQAGEGRGFFGALGQRDLMPLWFIGSSFALSLSSAFVFLRLFVEEEGYGAGGVGLFFATYTGMAIVLRITLGWVPDRIGPMRVFYPAMFAIGACALTLAVGDGLASLAVAGLFAGLGHGFAFPILSAVVVGRAAAADRGSAVSLFTAVFDAGILAGGPLLGGIARAASFRTMFAVAAAVPVLCLVVFHLWDRRATVLPVPEPAE
jgi:MFS family permease